MKELVLEIRPLANNRTLIVCANGAKLLANAEPCTVSSEFSNIQAEHLTASNAPLVQALIQNGCLKEVPDTPNWQDTANSEPNENDTNKIVVCGDRIVASLISSCLRKNGLNAWPSLKTPRESSYEVFKGGLLVVIRSSESETQFIDETRMLNNLNIDWIPISYHSGYFTVGPLMGADHNATYVDLIQRRRANSVSVEVADALMQAPIGKNFLDFLRTQERAVLQCANLLEELISYSDDSCSQSKHDTVWHVQHDGSMSVHPVLPCALINELVAHNHTHDPSFLVDRHYGIVKELTRVSHAENVPSSLTTIQARATDLQRFSDYVNTVFCQGSALTTDPPSKEDNYLGPLHMAAIGESVERYCSNLIDLRPTLFGSYDELHRKGFPMLDPAEIVLFSKWQYAQPGFPFVPMMRDLSIHWIEGKYLDDDAPVFVPASLVYVNWHVKQHRNEPKVNFPAFAGVASGCDLESSILSGLSEIIERHATMVWWLNKQPLAHLKITDTQLEYFRGARYTLRPALMHLENVFNVPVAAGVVHNDSSKLVHVGFSARSSIEEAALKAWSEALTLQEGAHDLLNPNGTHWQAIQEGLLPGRSYKPWRAQRNYLEDFREDFKDVDDLLVQQQVFLDPRAVEAVSPLLDLPPTKDQADITALEGDPLDALVQAISARGLRAITVDISSPDVARCGFYVTRTIVPGTVGNTPSAFPYLGNRVVQDEAVELGWREAPIHDSDINALPLPHA